MYSARPQFSPVATNSAGFVCDRLYLGAISKVRGPADARRGRALSVSLYHATSCIQPNTGIVKIRTWSRLFARPLILSSHSSVNTQHWGVHVRRNIFVAATHQVRHLDDAARSIRRPAGNVA